MIYLQLEAEGLRLLPVGTRREIADSIQRSPKVDLMAIGNGTALFVEFKAARRKIEANQTVKLSLDAGIYLIEVELKTASEGTPPVGGVLVGSSAPSIPVVEFPVPNVPSYGATPYFGTQNRVYLLTRSTSPTVYVSNLNDRYDSGDFTVSRVWRVIVPS